MKEGNREMGYAPAQHWDQYFSKLHQSDQDLDWGTQWIGAFIKPLHQADCRTILDLGCGSGNEVLGSADPSETREHDGSPVGNVGYRFIEGLVNFVFHCVRPPGLCAAIQIFPSNLVFVTQATVLDDRECIGRGLGCQSRSIYRLA